VIEPVFDWHLLIGDETALPAIGRRVEELGAGTRVITLAAVTDAAEEQTFATRARHVAHWVHRPAGAAADPAPLLAAAGGLTLPQGRGFVWIAAEAGVARALRDHLRGPMGHPAAQMKASGYWQQGQADSHSRIDD
jgi:NADPH-dependent ferric siderophore reductase